MAYGTYILDENNVPVPATTLELGAWLERDCTRKIVKQTTLDDGRWVSTVFLGLDHQYGDGPPLLFETMIFAVPEKDESIYKNDEYCERYSTWEAAEQGHEKACLLTKPYYDE